VLGERAHGLTQIEVIDRATSKSTFVKFPDATYVVGLGANYEYDISYVRLNYQSMVRPGSVYDFDFATGNLKLIKMNEVPTYDASKYESERVWATASDGTKIPVSLVYRKDLRAEGRNPVLVYGYGSYGYSMDPSFRMSVFSLLDRGFVYAIAHVRGGSEMGRAWYEHGRMGHKKNSFTDFIAVTEFLVEKGYADRTKVFASGGSAGGLLMGAISNLRPDLYRGIVSIVPFVDVVTTMLDADIPLTTAEYEQWGNPNDKDAYKYIKSYSPYDNLERKAYPAMLLMTGYHDSQVQYWEPAKYVAKLRDNTTSGQPILFRIDMEAGHSGASGRFAPLKETAIQWAFCIKLADADR
jgi:oligopeptidase B